MPEDYAKQLFFSSIFGIIFNFKFVIFQETFFFVCTQSHPARGNFWNFFVCTQSHPREKNFEKPTKTAPGFEMNFRPLKKHFFVKMTIPKIFPFTGNNMTLSCFLKNNCYTDLQFFFFCIGAVTNMCLFKIYSTIYKIKLLIYLKFIANCMSYLKSKQSITSIQTKSLRF